MVDVLFSLLAVACYGPLLVVGWKHRIRGRGLVGYLCGCWLVLKGGFRQLETLLIGLIGLPPAATPKPALRDECTCGGVIYTDDVEDVTVDYGDGEGPVVVNRLHRDCTAPLPAGRHTATRLLWSPSAAVSTAQVRDTIGPSAADADDNDRGRRCAAEGHDPTTETIRAYGGQVVRVIRYCARCPPLTR